VGEMDVIMTIMNEGGSSNQQTYRRDVDINKVIKELKQGMPDWESIHISIYNNQGRVK
jgi:hypothetical protein